LPREVKMTKEEIIEIANQASKEWLKEFPTPEETAHQVPKRFLEIFAKLVAEKEREECAEICDGFYLSWIDIQGRYEFMGEGASECAGAIRARGKE